MPCGAWSMPPGCFFPAAGAELRRKITMGGRNRSSRLFPLCGSQTGGISGEPIKNSAFLLNKRKRYGEKQSNRPRKGGHARAVRKGKAPRMGRAVILPQDLYLLRRDDWTTLRLPGQGRACTPNHRQIPVLMLVRPATITVTSAPGYRLPSKIILRLFPCLPEALSCACPVLFFRPASAARHRQGRGQER